jgi:hypothetical protein
MQRVLTPAERVRAGSGGATIKRAPQSRPASTAGGSSIDERLQLLREACDELQDQSEEQARVNTKLRNEIYRLRKRAKEMRAKLQAWGIK